MPATVADDMNDVANNAKEGGSSLALDVEEQLETPKNSVRTVHGFKVKCAQTAMLMTVAARYRDHQLWDIPLRIGQHNCCRHPTSNR